MGTKNAKKSHDCKQWNTFIIFGGYRDRNKILKNPYLCVSVGSF